MSRNEFVSQKFCQICFKYIVKFDQLNCKKCKVNTCKPKVSNCKVFKVKFNSSAESQADILNVTQKYIESKSNSNSLNGTKSLSLIQHTHKCDNIHSYEWSNFQKVEQLGDFILSYNQFNVLEFIFRWSEDLQYIPRVQSFIYEHKIQLEGCYNKTKTQLNSFLAHPILLILQKPIWIGLMESYFKYFHPQCMLFSLIDFNPKTASHSLLSDIYSAEFIVQSGTPYEILSY